MKQSITCLPHLREWYDEGTEQWHTGPMMCTPGWVEVTRQEYRPNVPLLWGECNLCAYDEPLEIPDE